MEFLDEMKTYLDKDENILVNHLHAILILSELVSMSCLWSILHLAIVMPMQYLAAHTHEWVVSDWSKFIFLFAFDPNIVSTSLIISYFLYLYCRSHFFRTCP